jgi:hypothetical protein
VGRETGVLPVRVNPDEAFERRKREGTATAEDYRHDLRWDSDWLGMGEPPEEVVQQYDLYRKLGEIPDGISPKERLKKALQIGGFPDIPVATDEQAENYYERFRALQLHLLP